MIERWYSLNLKQENFIPWYLNNEDFGFSNHCWARGTKSKHINELICRNTFPLGVHDFVLICLGVESSMTPRKLIKNIIFE